MLTDVFQHLTKVFSENFGKTNVTFRHTELYSNISNNMSSLIISCKHFHYMVSIISLDGSTFWNCSQNYTEPVHLAYKYAELSWCPAGSSMQHSNQQTVEKMSSLLANLPVLSRSDCEVNAPLGPASHLLQGTELTNVLDQVVSGASWY